ncbi:hypothetical protein ACQ9ZF_12365 (plasmid) [Cetobacterium somerae]|uniref:hypothetical protein n=1 Tax=Cetobacterium somerae TaxID=188913 RepID=UPI003D766E7A
MKEIEFYFDWDNHKVIFNDGTICDINEEKNSFIYRNTEFTLEADVEKDLSNTFNIRYVNLTEY